jgi:uncharacterized protein
MKKVFADSSYWTAMLNPRDQLHAEAFRVTRELQSMRMVTSEMVFAEVLNSAGGDLRLRLVSAELVESRRKDPRVTVVKQTPEQFEGALQRYRMAADKGWSLTDCASFLIMEEMGIRDALTYDRHFEQAGFEALLR